MKLADIPSADGQQKKNQSSARSKRKGHRADAAEKSDYSDSENSDLFVSGPRTTGTRPSRRAGSADEDEDDDMPQEDDKKKLGLNTSYDGFSIYGRILCLVVKRRGARIKADEHGTQSSQAMLENWVSTQAAAEQIDVNE